MGAIVGRFANRIGGATFSLEDHEYTLEKNDGANTNHGGYSGFHSKIWKGSYEGNKIVFRLSSAHLEGGYPGNVEVTVSYSFTSDGMVSIDFDGVSDRLTVLNLTNHAYFNLAGKGDILQHRVTIPSSYILETNAEFIPSGGILPVEATEFDFRYGKNIGKDIEKQTQQLEWNRGYNHCYVFSLYDERKMKWTASVYEPKSRRKLDVFTTYPGVLFYSSGYLSSQIVGKQGYKYTPMCGFCLETQYFPDFPNHSEFPQGVVFPEKPYHHTTLYKLSVV
jgi:aldose 1-epimerase